MNLADRGRSRKKPARPEWRAMRRSWFSPSGLILLWFVPAAFTIYIKFDILSLEFEELASWEKLSFFRADLFIGFLLVPSALLLVDHYFAPRFRTTLILLVSTFALIVLYCQLRAFQEVGQFLSFHMFVTAISWALQDPSAIPGYLGLRLIVATLILALSVALLWRWAAVWKQRHGGTTFVTDHHSHLAVLGLLGCSAVLTVIAWVGPFSSTRLHGSVLVRSVRSLANPTDVDSTPFQNLSISELHTRYREMTSSPAPERDARYWAKAQGCNVLFLVLETAPARILPALGDDLADFPNLRRLRRTSFAGVSHFSTYPATHQAMFSIFSSWYPSFLPRNFTHSHPDLIVPGLVRRLAELGYDTAFYSPFDFKGESDATMYRALGFARQVYPETRHPRLSGRAFLSAFDLRLGLDRAALNLLTRDLEKDLTQKRRFAFLFAPEISHGPWSLVKPAATPPDIANRGRALLRIPDIFLGEIIRILERHNQLKQTIIVVVGDHGIRTREEDPEYSGNLFGDYAFHVPLFVYAPQALDHTERISWVTSHIDIAPTVLDLLGVERDRVFEEGTPIWDRQLANRTTYFFSHAYMGAAAYCSNNTYFVWDDFTDSVYESNRLDFDRGNVAPADSPLHQQVTRSILRMAGLQEVWAMHFTHAKALRNHIYN